MADNGNTEKKDSRFHRPAWLKKPRRPKFLMRSGNTDVKVAKKEDKKNDQKEQGRVSKFFFGEGKDGENFIRRGINNFLGLWGIRHIGQFLGWLGDTLGNLGPSSDDSKKAEVTSSKKVDNAGKKGSETATVHVWNKIHWPVKLELGLTSYFHRRNFYGEEAGEWIKITSFPVSLSDWPALGFGFIFTVGGSIGVFLSGAHFFTVDVIWWIKSLLILFALLSIIGKGKGNRVEAVGYLVTYYIIDACLNATAHVNPEHSEYIADTRYIWEWAVCAVGIMILATQLFLKTYVLHRAEALGQNVKTTLTMQIVKLATQTTEESTSTKAGTSRDTVVTPAVKVDLNVNKNGKNKSLEPALSGGD